MALLETLHKSADFIKNSKRMLLLTSAGMSADSNIPTFRDKNGYWKNFPPFKEKNLEAQDLASPWAFRNVLPHAWAFYEWRRCLLYTSPSPRDLSTSRMPSSA